MSPTYSPIPKLFYLDWLLYTYLHPTIGWELMNSVGSGHGILSLLFMMKVAMVWHFVSDSHKVMTELVVMLAFKWSLQKLVYNDIDQLLCTHLRPPTVGSWWKSVGSHCGGSVLLFLMKKDLSAAISWIWVFSVTYEGVNS
jgi:hypothetical protein